MTDQARARLRLQLIQHEGLRLRPYVDTVGKVTIGIGRNLTDCGISRDEAFFLLDNDIDATVHGLLTRFPWFADLDEVRQRVICDMAFNLGVPGLARFTNTLASMAAGDYVKAGEQMLHSKWAAQVGQRAVTLAAMMRSGHDPV